MDDFHALRRTERLLYFFYTPLRWVTSRRLIETRFSSTTVFKTNIVKNRKCESHFVTNFLNMCANQKHVPSFETVNTTTSDPRLYRAKWVAKWVIARCLSIGHRQKFLSAKRNEISGDALCASLTTRRCEYFNDDSENFLSTSSS